MSAYETPTAKASRLQTTNHNVFQCAQILPDKFQLYSRESDIWNTHRNRTGYVRSPPGRRSRRFRDDQESNVSPGAPETPCPPLGEAVAPGRFHGWLENTGSPGQTEERVVNDSGSSCPRNCMVSIYIMIFQVRQWTFDSPTDPLNIIIIIIMFTQPFWAWFRFKWDLLGFSVKHHEITVLWHDTTQINWIELIKCGCC